MSRVGVEGHAYIAHCICIMHIHNTCIHIHTYMYTYILTLYMGVGDNSIIVKNTPGSIIYMYIL